MAANPGMICFAGDNGSAIFRYLWLLFCEITHWIVRNAARDAKLPGVAKGADSNCFIRKCKMYCMPDSDKIVNDILKYKLIIFVSPIQLKSY